MFIGDQVRPGFWRYRDYVIRAFNSDKPYDRFITEQIAGDELFDWRKTEAFTPEQVDTLAATGFLRCPPDATDNQPITQEEKIYPAQQLAMEVSMKAVLGLSLNCVRCHSHKFDPSLTRKDYQLIALFQPAYDPNKWLPGIWSDPHPGPIRAIPILPQPARDKYLADARAWPVEEHQLQDQIRGGLFRKWRDAELGKRMTEIDDEKTRTQIEASLQKDSSSRSSDDERTIASHAERLGLTPSALERGLRNTPMLWRKQRRVSINSRRMPRASAMIWATFDVSTNPSPTHLLRRGEYEQPAEVIHPGIIRVLDPEQRFDLSRAPFRAPAADLPSRIG